MDTLNLKNIIEAALLAAGGPLTIAQIQTLFGDNDPPERKAIKEAVNALREDYEGRGVEVVEVASGFRIQVRQSMSQWLTKLWEERPPRYSRALLETLAIVAYRQPVTRGDIEEIRGVSVTTNIIRTLLERNWIKVVGHRDVPGKPAMFGTTREFLDYFSLKKLDDLPPLAELAQLEPMGVQLELGGSPEGTPPDGSKADESAADDAEGDGETTRMADGSVADPAAEASLDDADTNSENENNFDNDSNSDYDNDNQIVDELDDDIDTEDLSAEPVAEDDSEIADEEYDEDKDLPPGAAERLVGLRKPGEGPPEPATVSSLDDARAAAAEQGHEPETDFHEAPAEVVPLKSS